MAPRFRFGDVIEFRYSGKYSHDPNPVILVTHPNWDGKVQGININYLTSLQLIHLLALAHTNRAEDLTLGFPQIQAELKKIGKVPDITKPLEFYGLVLENPANRLNVFRTYFPSRMSNVQFRTAEILNKFTRKAEQERKQAKAQEEEFALQQAEEEEKELERIEKEREEQEKEKEHEEEVEAELEEARKRKKRKVLENKNRKKPKIKRAKRKK
jgi:hypothetical protein